MGTGTTLIGTGTTLIGIGTTLPQSNGYQYHPFLVSVPNCEFYLEMTNFAISHSLFFNKPPQFHPTSKPTIESIQNNSKMVHNPNINTRGEIKRIPNSQQIFIHLNQITYMIHHKSIEMFTNPYKTIAIHTNPYKTITIHTQREDSNLILYKLGFYQPNFQQI